MAALLDIAEDPSRFKEFTEQLVAQASEGGQRSKKDVWSCACCRRWPTSSPRTHPEQLDRILNQIAGVMPRLTPDLVVTLITTGVPARKTAPLRRHRPGRRGARAAAPITHVAEFVAQSVSRDPGATERLAQAFQALVPDADKRDGAARDGRAEAAQLPIGRQPDFPDLWKSAADAADAATRTRTTSRTNTARAGDGAQRTPSKSSASATIRRSASARGSRRSARRKCGGSISRCCSTCWPSKPDPTPGSACSTRRSPQSSSSCSAATCRWRSRCSMPFSAPPRTAAPFAAGAQPASSACGAAR